MTEPASFTPLESSSPGPVPSTHLGQQLCQICNKLLTVHEQVRGGSCSDPSCRQRWVAQCAHAAQRKKAALRARAAEKLNELAQRNGVEGSEERAIAVVPTNDRRITDQSPARVEEFARHLQTKIAEAFDDDPDGVLAARDSVYPDPELTPEQVTLLGQACGTCRGRCCWQGETHAFVRRETILRYREYHPEARPEEIVSDYLDRLPARSYENACVYQTERGCVLPREMRSSTCNHFLCRPLTDFLVDLIGKGVSRGFAVATDDEERFLRSDLIELPSAPDPIDADAETER